MALLKPITLETGITFNYHRVVSVNQIINHRVIIETKSYTTTESRESEKRGEIILYSKSDYMELPYGQVNGVVDAYYYLKTLEKFEDAEDV